MIPILNKVGIAWTVVANTHLTRSCADFPLVLGSGGENCDIPNLADQLNPAQGAANYKRISIERGCSPSAAMPFAFQVHYARYVDPATGAESKIIVVPADQALGWRDSYSGWDLGLMGDLAARNNPAKPALVLMAHDGDNAWSGGYSYYMEWVPNFAGQAAARGIRPAPSSSSSRKTRRTPMTSCTSKTAAGCSPTAISARRCSSTGTGRRAIRAAAGTSWTPASAPATRPTTGA